MSKKQLRQAAADILPSAYLDAKDYLAALYAYVKPLSELYSYVRFTEDLGFGACNAMYLIIHGKRPLTRKGAAELARCPPRWCGVRVVFGEPVEGASAGRA